MTLKEAIEKTGTKWEDSLYQEHCDGTQKITNKYVPLYYGNNNNFLHRKDALIVACDNYDDGMEVRFVERILYPPTSVRLLVIERPTINEYCLEE